MTDNLITELCESRLITSKTAYRKYTGRDLSELLYLHLIAFRILSCEPDHSRFIRDYSYKTKRQGVWTRWTQTSTDLYLLMLVLCSGDESIPISDAARNYLDTLSLDDDRVMNWVKAVASNNGVADTYARRLFVLIDRQMKIEKTSLRSIRRLAMNWDKIDHYDQQLAMTKLLQLMKMRCPGSDLLPSLMELSKARKLELKNLSDPERSATLTEIAAQQRLNEDDAGSAPAPAEGTTSADIAPLVKPIGKVQRRPKP